MYRLFTILFLAISAFTINAQDRNASLLESAKTYNTAFLSGDFETYAKMTVPSVVKLAGGHELMVQNAKAAFDMNAETGLKYLSINPKKVNKFVQAGDELHAILPQTVVNKFGDTKFSRVMYYLATSADDGKSWSFLDLEPYTSDGSIKTFVPTFTGELKIPEFEQPQIIEE